MPDDKDEEELTPTQTPEAKRRRSSQSLSAPVKCPACNVDPRDDDYMQPNCDCCFNATVKGPTRWVTPERAAEWLASHRPTPIVPK